MHSYTRTPYIDMSAGVCAAVIAVLMLGSVMATRAYVQNTRHVEARLVEARQAERVADAAVQRLSAVITQRDSLQRVADLRHPDTLWLARVIMSESDRGSEQRLVAWVVRNRVQAEFRGYASYRGVALDRKQFSAFNRSSPLREYYMTLNTSDADTSSARGRRWTRALEIANDVRKAPESARPQVRVSADSLGRMPDNTLYFYSQISMPEYGHAPWAHQFERVEIPDVDTFRFRFFKDPACRGCGAHYSPTLPTASVR